VKDAVSVGLAGNPLGAGGNPLPPFLPQVFTATISDDTSVMLLARYTNGPLKLYGGYEWIQFAPPSDQQTAFNDISGDFICLGCAKINNTNINNTLYLAHDRIEQVFWTGAKYAVSDKLDVMGGYYHYLQNSFGAVTLELCTRESTTAWRTAFCIAAQSLRREGSVSNFEGVAHGTALPRCTCFQKYRRHRRRAGFFACLRSAKS
jgi:hypothetical protein